MRFMYVFAFAHTYKGKMFTPQSGGELNPIEIKLPLTYNSSPPPRLSGCHKG